MQAAAATNDHHDDDDALLLQVLQTPLPPLPHIQNARKSFARLTQEEFEAEVQLERTRRRNGGSSCASEKQQQQQQHASGSSLPSLQEEANNHQNDSKKQAAAAPTSIDPLTTATAAGAADDGSKKRAPPPAPAVLAHTDVKNHGTSTTTTAGRYHNSKRQRACHSLPLPLCPPPIFPIAPHAFAFAFPSLPSSFPTSYQHQNHHPLPAVATAASMMQQQQQPVWYPQYPPRPPQPIVTAVPPAASGVRRPPATAAAPRKMTAPATTTKVTKQPLVGVGVPPAQRTPGGGGGTAATTTTTAATATTSTRNQNTTTVALPPPAEAQQQQRLERFQAQWDKMYKELEKFRAEFGHACVPKPKRDPRYKSLRSWTNRQKKHWKLFLNGEKSALNQADIDKLIVVGLGTRRGPNDWNASRMESSWNSSYDELVAFRNVHGHCNVSRHHHRATHRSLGIWVSTQRKCFQNRQLKATTGEKRFQHYGIMSDLQFERLKALSFSFILENTNKKNDHENNDNSNGRDGDDDESDDAEEEENEQEYYG